MDTEIQRYKVTMRGITAHMSQQTFSLGSDSKHFWLCGPRVSVKTTQLCHCGVKAAIDDTSTNDCGCVSIILYLQEQVAAEFGLQATVASPDIAELCLASGSFGFKF